MRTLAIPCRTRIPTWRKTALAYRDASRLKHTVATRRLRLLLSSLLSWWHAHHLALGVPHPAQLIYYPARNQRSFFARAAIYRLGTRPGFPDIELCHASGPHIGLWLYVRPIDSTTPQIERTVTSVLTNAGYRVERISTLPQAISCVVAYCNATVGPL